VNNYEEYTKALTKGVKDAFHTLFYFSGIPSNWMGITCLQNPLDMWVLQEIIVETKPEVIIETGSAFGGSALFYASIFSGEVISVDLQTEMKPVLKHDRITFVKGSSTNNYVLDFIKSKIANKRVMVILDSDHSEKHVSEELKLYSELVTNGCYMVVCDTNISGNPIRVSSVRDGGPGVAVDNFMKETSNFIVDKSREKFLVTFFPNGWLRKVK
jgi:cephalosporin hydroxylase